MPKPAKLPSQVLKLIDAQIGYDDTVILRNVNLTLEPGDRIGLLGRNGEATGWTLVCGERTWEGAPPARMVANAPDLLINLARAGAGIAAVPDYFAAPSVRRGELRRVLPDWCMPSHTAWAVFPGRRLMPFAGSPQRATA